MTTNSRRLSDLEIATRIVPTSLQWPNNSTIAWDKLRGCVDSLRGLLRALDNECTTAESNPDFSTQGIERRRKELAHKALTELANFGPLMAAEKSAASDLSGLEERMNKLPSRATDVSDVMLAAEIRAHVGNQKSPIDLVMKSMSHSRVLGAVLNAPAFLSGLADEHLDVIRNKARETLHPEQTEKQRWLRKALDEVRKGVEATKRAVLERTGTRAGVNGQPAPGQAV